MNDPVLVTVVAVLAALFAAWLWVRRRWLRQVARDLPRLRTAPAAPSDQPGPPPAWRTTDRRLFLLSLAVYAVTRLVGIEDFPIYFFTDEAANSVLAAEFINNGLRDASGQLLPLYFSNTEKLSLSVSVYLQVLPYLLFGTSVFVTRATAALVGLSGAAAVGLILKDAFQMRQAWVGVMLLAITPAWFLHSRTAFETTVYVALFAWFLYFYLRYRRGHVRAVFPAVLFGALAFYAYNAGQAGVVLCAGLLLLVDARFHWENRRTALLGAALALVLILPYVRFQVGHPGEIVRRLQQLDSYLVRPDLHPAAKAARFVEEYAAGLKPAFWYKPEDPGDLIRHRMKGYGHLLWPTLPLAAVGLWVSLRRWRDPAHRAVLIAAFTAPVGGALAGLIVTRSLVMVVPAALLTFLGGAALLRWIGVRQAHPRAGAALFALLALVSGAMLWDALSNGPTWYSDYGLAGMQYGARQVFAEVSDYLAEHPQEQAWVFPTAWNGSDMLRRFFAAGNERILLLDLESFLAERFDAVGKALVVLTAQDYGRVTGSGKFTIVEVVDVLHLPDGSPGFSLVKLAYSPEADALFAAEREARRVMEEEQIDVGGRMVTVRHSPFDIGSVEDLFDGEWETMARTAGVNPAVIQLDFSRPIRLSGLTLATGESDVEIRVRLDPGGGLVPRRHDQVFRGFPPGSTFQLVLELPGPVQGLTVEVWDLAESAVGHVHLREISLVE
jgi:hypothetical protein